jgi:hypothetical protein
MNSRQRRTQQRSETIEHKIHTTAQKRGLARLLSDGIRRLQDKFNTPPYKTICGYSAQPIYVNQAENEITSACVLDPDKVCITDTPHDDFVYEQCKTYQRKMK